MTFWDRVVGSFAVVGEIGGRMATEAWTRLKPLVEVLGVAFVGGAADGVVASVQGGTMDFEQLKRSAIIGGVVGVAYWLRSPRDKKAAQQ